MNPALKPADLIEALQWRYAVKRFDPERQIPDEHWSAIEQSLVLTPSSYGMQPWKFLVVTNEQLREELTPASYGQRQVMDCSHLVVLCARDTVTDLDIDRHLDQTASVQGLDRSVLERLEGLLQRTLRDSLKAEQQRVWARNQIYLALGQLLFVAAGLGVDACPMEGFDPSGYDRILELEDSGYHSVVLAALGYRHPEDSQAQRAKVRFPLEHMIERRD